MLAVAQKKDSAKENEGSDVQRSRTNEAKNAVDAIDAFRQRVWGYGNSLYRDLPWRRTTDPYAIWVSEVMLQQTQVARVIGRWERWMERFPTLEALAASETADVLEEWLGMGYNRRAISLQRAARSVSSSGGVLPKDESGLISLPGIGPATAAGIRAFAFNLPGIYLETNVRTVFLHELFPTAVDIPDSVIIPYVRDTCPKDSNDWDNGPRSWYYALLDYGAYIKKTYPNPSRRSKSHKRQSAFEGSHRQKRAAVVRALIDIRAKGEGRIATEDVATMLSRRDVKKNDIQTSIGITEVQTILEELASEGFCKQCDGGWMV